MEIPADLIPVPGDGEAEGLIEELKQALAQGEFTPANGEVHGLCWISSSVTASWRLRVSLGTRILLLDFTALMSSPGRDLV